MNQTTPSRHTLAEILTTGDELLRGEVVNTNAAWLGARLIGLGLSLARVTTVGDALEPLVAAASEAVARCDVLLVSGGLGPTDDDRTTEAIARTAGALPLELHAGALQALRERFARGGYTLTPNNEKQAWLPRGATMLPNPNGTAPGFWLRHGRCQVFSMPGVPHEMKAMFEGEIVPRLRSSFQLTPALVRSINVFGLGESQVDARLAGMVEELCSEASGCEVTVHYCTSFPENRAILVVRPGASGPAAAEATLSLLEAEARRRLGHHVFGVGEASFSAIVVAALREAGATVALAESCTGGLTGDLLTRAAGSSSVFQLGVVAYANEFKEKVLGVPRAILEEHGAVSRECALAMARGIRSLAGSTYGVAVTGIAGPDGGTEAKPVGTVHFALAAASGERHLHRMFPSFGRQQIKVLSAQTALALLLHELRRGEGSPDDPLEGRWAAVERKG